MGTGRVDPDPQRNPFGDVCRLVASFAEASG